MFTLIAEVVGAIVLTVAFLVGGHAADPLQATWWGVFHAISAFNNGGMDLFGGYRSLADFVGDPLVLGTLGRADPARRPGLRDRRRHRGQATLARLALETRVVVLTTLAILVVGTASLARLRVVQPGDPRRAARGGTGRSTRCSRPPPCGRPASAPSRPAQLRDPTLFIVMAMMFIGGASGSTAGGIKVNTFSVLLIAIVSTVRGRPLAEALGRRIPHEVVYRALSVALLSIAFIFIVALSLELTTPPSTTSSPSSSRRSRRSARSGASTGFTPSCRRSRAALLDPGACSSAGSGRSRWSWRSPRGRGRRLAAGHRDDAHRMSHATSNQREGCLP